LTPQPASETVKDELPLKPLPPLATNNFVFQPKPKEDAPTEEKEEEVAEIPWKVASPLPPPPPPAAVAAKVEEKKGEEAPNKEEEGGGEASPLELLLVGIADVDSIRDPEVIREFLRISQNQEPEKAVSLDALREKARTVLVALTAADIRRNIDRLVKSKPSAAKQRVEGRLKRAMLEQTQRDEAFLTKTKQVTELAMQKFNQEASRADLTQEQKEFLSVCQPKIVTYRATLQRVMPQLFSSPPASPKTPPPKPSKKQKGGFWERLKTFSGV